MKRTLIVLVAATLLCCGAPAAQELPPDILADQYLMAATAALQQQDRQAAINAFQKIEALDVTPPAEFFYFYGKVLVENGIATGDVPSVEKGQALLKKYIVASGREAEHYRSALEVLNTVEEHRSQVARMIEMVDAQMVRIEGGTFAMGCTHEQELENKYHSCREKPVHWVEVRSFELSRYEVTQELWEAVMGENPSTFKNCPQCPVEKVSWDDVQAFLRKLNAGGGRYRLPSEAEWEYAARGGQRSRGYRYAGSNTPDAVAWYEENRGGKQHHPVGQKQANELGLYDLAGNVWEWVQDCWNESYAGAPSDGRAWESGDCRLRVMRGGSWYTEPVNLRSANRGRHTTDDRNFENGFRMAQSLP